MKLWVVKFHDTHEGLTLTWFSSRAAAERELRRLQREARSMGEIPQGFEGVELVNFPNSKPEVIRWLNVHCNRDNG